MADDGITARIVSVGPSPEDLIARLSDHRPAWDDLRALLLDPASYERSDRYEGRNTMPRERTRREGGGYDVQRWGDDRKGYKGAMRVGRTKKRLKLTSRRPKAPELRDAIHDRVAEVDANHVLGGPVRREEKKL